MNIKKIFKEIEIHVIEENSRVFIDTEDLSKTLYEICFSKTELDIHTIRVIKRLVDSIAKTYKILKETDDFDINTLDSIVELSRKKVKALILKSYALSKKDKAISDSALDELEEFLGPDEESLQISKEETVDLISTSISSVLEPFLQEMKKITTTSQKPLESPKEPKPKPDKKKANKNLLKKDDLEELEELEEEFYEEL